MNKQAGQRKSGGGWTLVEMLVALAVGSAFLAGVMTAFIQILRASDRSERMTEAYQNARAAVEAIAVYVKAARIEPSQTYQFFQGVNVPTLSGDRIDNDGDGRIDEELVNGLDDDGDWVLQRDDHHARMGAAVERRNSVGRPDLGDGHVDEDCAFNHDRLSLAIFPDPTIPGSRDELTSFALGLWEGENFVLLQSTIQDASQGSTVPQIDPLAFNVLSVNFLYWDPNRAEPYWVTQWDAFSGLFPPPGIELPAAVFIKVTVYSGRKPIEQVVASNEPLETVSACTIVDIESVIHDPRYEQFVRPNQ